LNGGSYSVEMVIHFQAGKGYKSQYLRISHASVLKFLDSVFLRRTNLEGFTYQTNLELQMVKVGVHCTVLASSCPSPDQTLPVISTPLSSLHWDKWSAQIFCKDIFGFCYNVNTDLIISDPKHRNGSSEGDGKVQGNGDQSWTQWAARSLPLPRFSSGATATQSWNVCTFGRSESIFLRNASVDSVRLVSGEEIPELRCLKSENITYGESSIGLRSVFQIAEKDIVAEMINTQDGCALFVSPLESTPQRWKRKHARFTGEGRGGTPSLSPNGRMVVFTFQGDSGSVILAVLLDFEQSGDQADLEEVLFEEGTGYP